MKEKILALLVAKFAGVRKDGLARLAQALSLQADNETEAGELVEKLTPEKVNDFVTDYRKDVDKEVSDANKTYEGTLKKKFDFIEKKDAEPGKEPKSTDHKPDDTPSWAKALIETNQQLTNRLNNIEGQKVTETRLQQLEGKLKDLPETFKTQKLKDFRRMNFESEETFTEYLGEVETDITGFKQELADKGLAGQSKPMMGGQNKEGISSAVAGFIASKTEDKQALTGKEV